MRLSVLLMIGTRKPGLEQFLQLRPLAIELAETPPFALSGRPSAARFTNVVRSFYEARSTTSPRSWASAASRSTTTHPLKDDVTSTKQSAVHEGRRATSRCHRTHTPRHARQVGRICKAPRRVAQSIHRRTHCVRCRVSAGRLMADVIHEQQCSVCTHPDRAEIDRKLSLGEGSRRSATGRCS